MTYVEARAAYEANADYDETGSVAKAKTFRTACRVLLASPSSVNKSSGSASQGSAFDLATIAAQLTAADRYVSAHDSALVGSGSAIHFDLTDFRS